jgi:hypothetical protein
MRKLQAFYGKIGSVVDKSLATKAEMNMKGFELNGLQTPGKHIYYGVFDEV